ncbi:MAG: P1 family peptidase [Henriciella sp.]|jgi:L-aminopeptidase/D-esterase-like protein
MNLRVTSVLLFAALAVNISAAANPQDELTITLNSGTDVLTFDWPTISVGTAQYEAGPTGVTVIRFAEKSLVAMDVRGGGPGTINAPYVELGYDMKELDTITLTGGSWYGLEAVTGVASALKDDGVRDGDAFAYPSTFAMSLGSVVFDFGNRRLNEIYPDKRLGQAAYRSAKPGRFAQGAHGGGRSTVTGSLFGCHAKSGQGAAFREYGEVKIAAFTVVNALGVIVDRDGRVVACQAKDEWPDDLTATDLMSNLPAIRDDDWGDDQSAPESRNTTISVVVTNQPLSPQELKRLAVQVQSSIPRAIQPYSTAFDGDVLYAVTTAELTEQKITPIDLGVLAGEVMWDAILNSVPEQPELPLPVAGKISGVQKWSKVVGKYRFSDQVSVEIVQSDHGLAAKALGDRSAFAISNEEFVPLISAQNEQYIVDARHPTVLAFRSGDLILNPGRWQQVGTKADSHLSRGKSGRNSQGRTGAQNATNTNEISNTVV